MNGQAPDKNRLLSCGVFGLLMALVIALNFAPVDAQTETSKTPPPSVAAAPRRTGSITGILTDRNGGPIARAIIMARRMDSAPNASPRTAETDAGGQFKLGNLPSGVYTLQPYAPEYATPSGNPAQRTYYHLGEQATLTMVKGGVLTGRVTNASGEPIVNTTVRLKRVRDAEGQPTNFFSGYNAYQFSTDDRGVYRIYGLEPGAYLVSVGGSDDVYMRNSFYSDDAPTYYPSATRDGAQEVIVREGQETGGIDIKHRGEQGHTVRGLVTGAVTGNSMWEGIYTGLKHAASGTDEASSYATLNEEDKTAKFEITGLPDGEYEIAASRSGFNTMTAAATEPLRLTVKGADVSGLELKLLPLSSLSGRVIFEPLTKLMDKLTDKPVGEAGTAAGTCSPGRLPEPGEVALTLHLSDRTLERKQFFQFLSMNETAASSQGDFIMRNLRAGLYRLKAVPPGSRWYIRSIASPAPAGKNALSPDQFNLRASDNLHDIKVTITEGAAGIRGKVSTGSAMPLRMFVYLIPVDPAQADDLLRYAETSMQADGSFAISNIAPGKYWLLAAPRTGKEETNENAQPLFRDATQRAKLRHDAEAAKKAIELKPCQRVNDLLLTY